MKFKISDRKFTVEFDVLFDTRAVVCILRSGDRIYSGVAICNAGDEWDINKGHRLVLRRALEAAIYVESAKEMIAMKGGNIINILDAQDTFKNLYHDYRHKLRENAHGNQSRVYDKLTGLVKQNEVMQ